ncbi:MAG TPA: DUF58 domain-containing protein [Vicinamibacterales bacterium]|nr:DUF58 domain-containing protein [Vicinamibacterales bacterium]
MDPALLASIGDLELVARVVVDGSVSGLHRSPFHGYSAEFSQYRHYRSGDDLKHVDWKLFARTDRFYTRQYRETTNLVAGLVLDASASMGYRGSGAVSKLQYGRLLLAGLAHLLGRQGDGVGLVVFSDIVREYLPARRGQLHIRRLLLALSKVEASGGTAAAGPLRSAIERLGRRGLLVIASDLYEEDELVEGELRRAVHIGHEVAVLHVLTPEEIDFPLMKDAELEDMESGVRVPASAGSRDDYRARVRAFLDRWKTRCASLGIDYVRATTDLAPDAVLRSYLLQRAGRIVG